ncbi:MAG TPA: MFS transporter [Gammaproteobacteria bacterium]|jgi:MFS family permease|nr:MFS transporter [Gammaproteobacteria bacterium]
MSYFADLSIFRRNPNFAFLFTGQFVSFLGSMITSVALPYQIYTETHSILMVGFLSLIQLLPLLVTALVGGVFADRYHRRMLLLVAEFSMAMGCLLLAFNASLSSPHIWFIFVIAGIMSSFNGLHRPALESIVQQIVERKDFPAVSAVTSFKYSLGMIVGPAVGGLLVAHTGLVVTYIVDFVSFAISLGALLMMSHIPAPEVTEHEPVLASLKSGVKYAFSRQELVGTYFVDFVAMIFGMPSALFPAIAQSYGGAKALGMLYSAPAVGALVVSLLSGWAGRVKRHGVAIAVSAALWGVSIIGFGLASNFWLGLVFLAFAGGFDAVSGIFRGIMWNETIPNKLRGRMAGIEMISYLSGPKLGDTEASMVAAAFGITVSVVSGGVLCVAGVVICCALLPKFWRYHSEQT